MRRLPSLNGLRAISVLLVIFYHLETYYRYGKHRVINETWFFFYSGELGVNIFFVISGFLITSLLIREENKTATISLKGFYFRRTLRIFPAYYFLLGVYFLLQRAGLLTLTTQSWISGLTYTKNLFYGEWYLSHAWSLSLEEQFYLVWPLLFKIFRSRRHLIAIAIVAVIPVLRGLSYQFHFSWAGTTSNLLRIDALMWGCLFAIYHEQLLGFVKRCMRRYRWAAGVPFLVLLGGYYFSLLNMQYHWHLGPLIIAVGHPNGTLVYLAIGFLLLYSVHYSSSGWFRFLNLQPLDYLGKLSYSLYLWQQVFIGTSFLLSTVPLNLICVFVMANVSYFFVEKPFLRLRERIQRKARSRQRPLRARELEHAL